MPDCDEALELISAQIDGALNQEEAAALAAHLEHCPACRALLADLEQIHSDLEAIPPVSPPSGLQEDIMARIRAEQKPRPRAAVRWRSWAAMAAVFAVVLLGAGALRTWQNGGSGAMYTSGGGAAPPTAVSQADQSGASAGADSGLTGEAAAPRDGGDAGEASQATASPVSPDTAVSSESGDDGNVSSPIAPSASSSASGSQESSRPAGGGSQPKPAPSGTDAQPRAEDPAPSQPQLYTATPAPTPGVDINITAAAVPTYLGILTLTWEEAVELSALEGLSYTTQGDTRTYVLPASSFEALVQHLGEGAAVCREGEGISPDATEGLILVTGVPETQP